MLSQLSFLFLCFALLIGTVFNPTSTNVHRLLGGSQKSRILLLTAHPDDECLFFTPTLSSLLTSSSMVDGNQASRTTEDVEVYSLCLSVGNADGLGDVRQDELARSLDVLGVAKSRRWIVDHP